MTMSYSTANGVWQVRWQDSTGPRQCRRFSSGPAAKKFIRSMRSLTGSDRESRRSGNRQTLRRGRKAR
jgi:hypothetical protein